MSRALQAAAFEFRPVRWVAGLLFLLLAAGFWLIGRRYRALDACCWVARVSAVAPWSWIARRQIDALVRSIHRDSHNPVIEWFRDDSSSRALARSYKLGGKGGPHDLFRDLIILKAPTKGEKGVILLKYVRTFNAVVALLDIGRLQERYTFVLEPCWSGYCHPAILMFIAPGHPVFVQCFTRDDYAFIESLGAPLVPMRLGPADWVNSTIFEPVRAPSKPYDLVMVANWARHKRHEQLFRALGEIRDRPVSVLLVGFAWGGRTSEDIRREAAAHLHDNVTLEIREKLPQPELARYLAQCKVFVFLSRKEGDNKALVEAMFADLPVIVYRETIGGASSRVNDATGVLASDHELAQKIRYMLDNHERFTPRQWALKHTGSNIATQVLDETLRDVTLATGGLYRTSIVEKTNAPNLAYKESADRARFAADYAFVLDCLRNPPLEMAQVPGLP